MADTTSIATDRLSTRARTIEANQYYVATISQPNSGLTFRAFVPETFNLSIQNHWQAIFGEQEQIGGALGRGAAAAGAPINLKYLSRQVWLGTEPLDFNLTFLLDAYSKTRDDVEQPIINLLKMSTPKRDGLLLKSPGPSLISDQNRIYLRIGKFFVLDSIIIRSVDITFFTIADKTDGRYMSADLNVHISTAYTPDQDDILNYFSRGQSGDNNLDPNNKVPSAIAAIGDKVVPAIQKAANDLGNQLTSVSGITNLLGIKAFPGL